MRFGFGVWFRFDAQPQGSITRLCLGFRTWDLGRHLPHEVLRMNDHSL